MKYLERFLVFLLALFLFFFFIPQAGAAKMGGSGGVSTVTAAQRIVSS